MMDKVDERITALEKIVAKQSEQIEALLRMVDLTADSIECLNSEPCELSNSRLIRAELEELKFG
jgi:uncharacterized coiled-coil protein SlyX